MNMNMNMKKFNFLSLLACFAVFHQVAGQFAGPTSQTPITSVSAVISNAMQLDYDDTKVSLKGRILSHLNRDYYYFGDQTGTLLIELEDEVLPPQPFNEQTVVILYGEIEAGWFERVKLDVERIVLLPMANPALGTPYPKLGVPGQGAYHRPMGEPYPPFQPRPYPSSSFPYGYPPQGMVPTKEALEFYKENLMGPPMGYPWHLQNPNGGMAYPQPYPPFQPRPYPSSSFPNGYSPQGMVPTKEALEFYKENIMVPPMGYPWHLQNPNGGMAYPQPYRRPYAPLPYSGSLPLYQW